MKLKYHLFSIILILFLLSSALPLAFAKEDEIYTVTLNGDSLTCSAPCVAVNGSTLTISGAGTFEISGTLDDGQIRVDASKKDKVKLVLKGASVTCSGAPAIYVLSADKTVLTTYEGTQNFLCTNGSFSGDDGADAAVFSRDDLTLNGEGTLFVTAEAGHGIVCKNDLKITSGEVTVNAGEKGLCGKDSISVKSGDIRIESADDAVHSDGDVTISSGRLTVSTGDDGIHADNALLIEGGSVTVNESYEGLEGKTVTVTGGIISVTASDDGFNAAGGNDGSSDAGKFGRDSFRFMNDTDTEAGIFISGGSVSITALGDGIDSNGCLVVSGGKVLISGPESSFNGALDFGTTATVSGGTVIAAGASGMAVTFGNDSTQASILYSFSKTYPAGTPVRLTDASGKEIVSYSPVNSFSSVVISEPALKSTGTYYLSAGSDEFTVEMDGVSWTNMKSGMPGGPGGRGGGFPGGPASFGGGFPGNFGEMAPEIPGGNGMPQMPGMPEPPEGFGEMAPMSPDKAELPEEFRGMTPRMPDGAEQPDDFRPSDQPEAFSNGEPRSPQAPGGAFQT